MEYHILGPIIFGIDQISEKLMIGQWSCTFAFGIILVRATPIYLHEDTSRNTRSTLGALEETKLCQSIAMDYLVLLSECTHFRTTKNGCLQSTSDYINDQLMAIKMPTPPS
jgi:hypothetical protein